MFWKKKNEIIVESKNTIRTTILKDSWGYAEVNNPSLKLRVWAAKSSHLSDCFESFSKLLTSLSEVY